MLSNSVSFDIPKEISIEQPNLSLVDPNKSTMDKGPNPKRKVVKRGYKKPKNKLASARMKGKSKAQARAAARALAKTKLDLNYIEPKSLFDEAESESESDARDRALYIPYPKFKPWTRYGVKKVLMSKD